MHPLIDDLNWRYATKKFDASRQMSDEDLAIIKESLRLLPTSYGLQTMKFIFVESPDLREALLEASFNQQQIVDASHLLVLCAYDDITLENIDEHVTNSMLTREIPEERIQGYADYMKRTVGNMDNSDKRVWLDNQVYIALGQLLATCATLRIDATPMEGFNRIEYDRILGLSSKGIHSVLVCPIGYRHADDRVQHLKKIRKTEDKLFENL